MKATDFYSSNILKDLFPVEETSSELIFVPKYNSTFVFDHSELIQKNRQVYHPDHSAQSPQTTIHSLHLYQQYLEPKHAHKT